jgi:dTDP-4-dehydrorhamnose reductase
MGKIKVLILGASGMLGHMLLNIMSKREDLIVKGTVRSFDTLSDIFLKEHCKNIYVHNVNAQNLDSLKCVVNDFEPDVIINAIGIIKQIKQAYDPVTSISINSLFPHTLRENFSSRCKIIYISTDCVFDGLKGNYTETCNPTPVDLYGRSKLLGEVTGHDNCVTIRTSIIGHELQSSFGLLDWFRTQRGGTVKGFSKAIYSGFPVTELEKIIYGYVLKNDLKGLYHVSSEPINKYDLLRVVNTVYDLGVNIEKDESFILDRSLKSDHFTEVTGYKSPDWSCMIKDLKTYFDLNKKFYV